MSLQKTLLLTESEKEFQWWMNFSVCTRRKLKVNARKSKIWFLERKQRDLILSKVNVPAVGRCYVV